MTSLGRSGPRPCHRCERIPPDRKWQASRKIWPRPPQSRYPVAKKVVCQMNTSSTHIKSTPKGITLNQKCHFDEILVTGCIGGYHFDNFRCRQWWRFKNDISVSLWAVHAILFRMPFYWYLMLSSTPNMNWCYARSSATTVLTLLRRASHIVKYHNTL